MAVERLNDLEVRVTIPITDADVSQLKIGDHVRISGVIYTARDAAHGRMVQTLDAGEELPIDLKGQLLYYVGPTPPRPGRVAGAFGPTTSMRMDPFTPRLLAEGLKATMGKGNRGPEVQEALRKYHAGYFMAVGAATCGWRAASGGPTSGSWGATSRATRSSPPAAAPEAAGRLDPDVSL